MESHETGSVPELPVTKTGTSVLSQLFQNSQIYFLTYIEEMEDCVYILGPYEQLTQLFPSLLKLIDLPRDNKMFDGFWVDVFWEDVEMLKMSYQFGINYYDGEDPLDVKLWTDLIFSCGLVPTLAAISCVINDKEVYRVKISVPEILDFGPSVKSKSVFVNKSKEAPVIFTAGRDFLTRDWTKADYGRA